MISHELAPAVKSNTEIRAANLINNGMTKTVVALIAGTKQPCIYNRYPHLNDLLNAQMIADAIEQPRKVNLYDWVTHEIQPTPNNK